MTEVNSEVANEVEAVPQANVNAGSIILELRAAQTAPSGRLFELFPRSPEVDRRPLRRPNWMFLLIVAAPVLLSTVYYGFIAADQYVTEAKFIVRTAANSPVGGLATLVSSRGLSRAQDETYAVDEYLVSPDIISLLNKDGLLTQIFTRPEADFLSRFPGPLARNSLEQFKLHFKDYVNVKMEATTGISTLQVSTFRAEDSFVLASRLMALSEDFVNQLNDRANADAMSFAENIQNAAVERLKVADDRLAEYRNRELVVDPGKEISALIDQLGKMALEISEMEAVAARTAAQTPNNPQIESEKQRIKASKNEYDRLRSQIVGGNGSLSSKLSQYQRLVLDRDLAAKAVTSAALGIEQARQEAKSRRIYLQSVVNPRRSDMATRPRRLFSILMILGLVLSIYMVVRTFYTTVLEHQA